MEDLKKKQIQIVDLKPQYIQALKKNKYLIKGNDGITYECWDEAFFNRLQIGKFGTLTYYIKQTQGNNGKLYTNYVVYIPKTQGSQGAAPAQPQGIAASEILERINVMEKNIIDAIRMHTGNNIKIEEDDVPDVGTINQELQFGQTDSIPVIDETPGAGDTEYQGADVPF